VTGPVHEHVDAVVVGSGFGGSVAAFRLADTGLSVILLERGRPYPPGSFTQDLAALQSRWAPHKRRYGLFELRHLRHFDAVVASGLGGGSLIYANVLMRKDERWFVRGRTVSGGGHESWPVTRAELDPHYAAVERVLRPTPYPVDRPGYAATPKTVALRDAATRLGLEFHLPPLAVSFAPRPGGDAVPDVPIVEPDGNLHNAVRRTCCLCGECALGCNNGAKNSLDVTYLSAAVRRGLDLRTGHEVRTVRPCEGGGYEVRFVEHPTGAAAATWGTLHCDRLVLAAGTFGTANLLLRCRRHFPGLSRALGTRFSTNGNAVAFVAGSSRRFEPNRGPSITGAVRLPDELDGAAAGSRGGYVEDGGYPMFGDHLTATLPLLAMGRDVPNGVIELRNGRLDVRWSPAASRQHFDRVRGTMRDIAGALGGRYVDYPGWVGRRTVAVHVTGGAPMADHPADGVCDRFGEVHGYPGLFVMDGAALPGPVGVNPALTIAALADRACDHLLEHRRVARPHPAATAVGRDYPDRTTVQFTEVMLGTYRVAASEPMRARLTVTVDDVDAFLDEPEHPARVDGWVEAQSLGGRCAVLSGTLSILAPGARAGDRELRYVLALGAANPCTLVGRKVLRRGPAIRLWPEATVLRFRIAPGHAPGEEAAALGDGVLSMSVVDFARQLTTFRATGRGGAAAIGRFAEFFLDGLWSLYRPRPRR
jgi:cholesterol oxidase